MTRRLRVLREPAVDARNTAPVPGLESLDALLQRTRRTGLDVGLAEHGTPAEPPREVAVTVYRLIQEALTNVVKHAGARRVTVDLDWSPDALAITVEDDGRGPDRINGGHGLIGMRERVDACGGELSTGPAASEHGFRVFARLPFVRAS